MAIHTIVYRFGDSSVPPPYHRSYTITVTPTHVHTVVDSYGDTVAEGESSMSEAGFARLLAVVEAAKLHNCQLPEDNKGCTGGTSEKISWSGDAGEAFSGYIYHCAGNKEGDLCGDVDAVADAIKALVPDLADLRQ